LDQTRSVTDEAVAAVFREEAGRRTGALVRVLGNFDLAEEVVQDSLVAALEKWPEQGIPDNPGAWLMTTARRRAIDLLRRDRRYAEKVALLERSQLPGDASEADDRLRLIFTCCHPAIAQEAQVALTLRAVAGFTTPEIAAAFLVSEATMAQRIVRAKRKIVAAHIPYRVPQGEDVAERLDAVLAVLYLMFNEGYLSRGASAGMRRDLAEDALWLGRLLDRLMPGQPEVLGLVALMQLNLARSASTTCSTRRGPSCWISSERKSRRARRGCARSSCARTPPSAPYWSDAWAADLSAPCQSASSALTCCGV